MKFEIIWAKNGKIIKILPDSTEDQEEYIVAEEKDDEYTAFKNLFWELLQHCGPSDNKYSDKRLRIISLPGHCYEGNLSKEYREEILSLRDELSSLLKRSI